MKTLYRKRRRKALFPLFAREQMDIYELQRGKDKKKVPFQEQYRRFMLTERGCSPGTAKSNLHVLRQFAYFLQREYGLDFFCPGDVTPLHVRGYLAHLKNERQNSPSTRNQKLGVLASYYYFLECCEVIEEDDNPLSGIQRARVPRRLPVYLTLEEAERLLLAAVSGPEPLRDEAVLRLMLQTGLRASELAAVRLKDVDTGQRCLLVRGKDHRQRLVPLTRNTAAALEKYSEQCTAADAYPSDILFLDDWGRPFQSKVLNDWFRHLCWVAGIEKQGLTVRNLRHTCLTLLLQEGADLMALKELAGHKKLTTTQRYLHVTQNQLRQAIKKHPLG